VGTPEIENIARYYFITSGISDGITTTIKAILSLVAERFSARG